MEKIEGNVPIEEILIDIGFLPTEDGLQFDFGNFKLKAIEGMNRSFFHGFHFFGFYTIARSAGTIRFHLPLKVESHNQCIAFMAYYLRNAEVANIPIWLEEGMALKELLPWERELKAYNDNPKATIEHEWFRLIVRKMRLIASTSNNEDITTFSFDGTILKIVCNNQLLVSPAQGRDWGKIAKVKTESLDFLPKRIEKRSVSIYIWKEKLYIHNRFFLIFTSWTERNQLVSIMVKKLSSLRNKFQKSTSNSSQYTFIHPKAALSISVSIK